MDTYGLGNYVNWYRLFEEEILFWILFEIMLKLIKGWSISAERLFNKKIVSPLPINVEMIWNSESPKPANK